RSANDLSKLPDFSSKSASSEFLIFARRPSAADPRGAQDCELLISYVGCSVYVPMRDREVSFFEGTPVVGFFYTWTSHSATVTDSTAREVCCFNCRTSFEYQVTRTARGGGHSPFHMSQKRAAEDARRRAFINVNLALRDAIEPVYCPSCGVFQPD